MNDHKLDEMMKNIEKTDPADTFSASVKQPAGSIIKRRAKKPHRMIFVAAAIVLIVAMVLVVMLPMLRNIPNDESYDTSESTSGSEHNDVLPPWKNGRISLTAITYNGSNSSLSTSPSVKYLAAAASFSGEYDVSGDSLAISMLEGTKISSCVNGELLKITPREGEHTGCDGVYYNIAEDRTFCLSCTIEALIAEKDYYTDACVRAFIEECLITQTAVYAGVIDELYGSTYESIYQNGMAEKIASGYSPTLDELGVASSYTEKEKEYTQQKIYSFERPVVKIVEYGEDINKCLFTLVSASVAQGAYGLYLYEQDSEAVKKLDGDYVGVAHCVNGYFSSMPDDLPMANYADAVCVVVVNNYDTVVVTVPYFCSFLKYDEKTGSYVPSYTGLNVLSFDVSNGETDALFGEARDAQTQLSLPAQGAKISEGVIYYETVNGKWGFDGKLELSGELLKILSVGDEKYAVMKDNGSYTVYNLSDGTQVTPEEAGFADSDCYVADANRRVHIGTGESAALWEGDPEAQVYSASGRYIYMYFKDDAFVTCVDVQTGEVGYIGLSESFLNQSSECAGVEYLLFINNAEDRLIMAFYRQGELIFDRNGFFEFCENHPLSDIDPEQPSAAFEKNAELIFGFFLNDGKSVVFKDIKTAVKAAKLVAVKPLLTMFSQGKPTVGEVIADIGDAVAGMADFDSTSAFVTQSTLLRLLNGVSVSDFEEVFETRIFGSFSEYDLSVQLAYYDVFTGLPDELDAKEELAKMFAAAAMMYIYGYECPNEDTIRYY
ncbi:MAG TPA: hypothetical protein PLT66_03290, partial [Bacillota bacterium]|nr:hypothetical protein [Bacillota bacterium]